MITSLVSFWLACGIAGSGLSYLTLVLAAPYDKKAEEYLNNQFIPAVLFLFVFLGPWILYLSARKLWRMR